MDFSERCSEGFALAATIARDAGAQRAQAGLCAQAQATLLPVCRALAEASKAERREHVRRITASMTPSPRLGAPVWPTRPRPGWAPERPLLMLVRSHVSRPQPMAVPTAKADS